MSNKRFCDKCGKWVPKVGLHPCAPRKPKTAFEKIEEGLKEALDVARGEAEPDRIVNVTSARTARWREKNREKARAYMRDYMRKRRSQENKESS